jgi:hypothetical protein
MNTNTTNNFYVQLLKLFEKNENREGLTPDYSQIISLQDI